MSFILTILIPSLLTMKNFRALICCLSEKFRAGNHLPFRLGSLKTAKISAFLSLQFLHSYLSRYVPKCSVTLDLLLRNATCGNSRFSIDSSFDILDFGLVAISKYFDFTKWNIWSRIKVVLFSVKFCLKKYFDGGV